MNQKFIVFLLGFSFLSQMTFASKVDDTLTQDAAIRPSDAKIKQLHTLLKSKLDLDDQQVSNFTDQLGQWASVPILRFQTEICVKGQRKVMPAKVLILAAEVMNIQRRDNGTWNFELQQQEQKFIERHLAQNPDPNVRKVIHEHGFYFTFDFKSGGHSFQDRNRDTLNYDTANDVPVRNSQNVVVPDSQKVPVRDSQSAEPRFPDRKHDIPNDDVSNPIIIRDSQIKKLHTKLRSEFDLNKQEISNFTNELLRCAAVPTLTIPSDIYVQGIKVFLPTKILIIAAEVIDMQRRLKGTWNFELQQQEQRFIESHLAQNPDPDVYKVAHDQGFYFTFDDK